MTHAWELATRWTARRATRCSGTASLEVRVVVLTTTWWRRGGRAWRRTRSVAGPRSCRESYSTEHQTTMIHEQTTGKCNSAAQLVSFRSAVQFVSARSAAQLVSCCAAGECPQRSADCESLQRIAVCEFWQRSAVVSPTAQRSCANCTPRSTSAPGGASTARARSTPRQATYARVPFYSAGGAHRGGHLRARLGVPRHEALRRLIRVARGALTVRQPAVHGSPSAAPSCRRPPVVRRPAALLQQRLQRPSSWQCRAVSRSEWCGRHCGPPPGLPRRRPRHACGRIRERQIQPRERPNKRMAEWMSTARLRRRGGGARQRRAATCAQKPVEEQDEQAQQRKEPRWNGRMLEPVEHNMGQKPRSIVSEMANNIPEGWLALGQHPCADNKQTGNRTKRNPRITRNQQRKVTASRAQTTQNKHYRMHQARQRAVLRKRLQPAAATYTCSPFTAVARPAAPATPSHSHQFKGRAMAPLPPYPTGRALSAQRPQPRVVLLLRTTP
eukprot:gene12245-biopygen4925